MCVENVTHVNNIQYRSDYPNASEKIHSGQSNGFFVVVSFLIVNHKYDPSTTQK